MWTWVLIAPLGFFILIFALDQLESIIVSPVERAARISAILELADPDEIEGTVAKMLAPVAPRRSPAS